MSEAANSPPLAHSRGSAFWTAFVACGSAILWLYLVPRDWSTVGPDGAYIRSHAARLAYDDWVAFRVHVFMSVIGVCLFGMAWVTRRRAAILLPAVGVVCVLVAWEASHARIGDTNLWPLSVAGLGFDATIWFGIAVGLGNLLAHWTRGRVPA